jgi:hypothetical protein
MKIRLSRLGALTVVASLGLLGCEHWRNGLRQDGEAGSKDADAKIFASEHSGSVKPGSLSRQAQEIESHFSGH